MTTADIIQKLIEQTLNGTRQWATEGGYGDGLWYTSCSDDEVHFEFRPITLPIWLHWLPICDNYTHLKMNNQHICNSPQMLEPLHKAVKQSFDSENSNILSEAIAAFEKSHKHETVTESQKRLSNTNSQKLLSKS